MSFLIGAGLLLALANLFVVPALWRHERAGVALVAGLIVLVVGPLLYLGHGSPRLLDRAQLAPPSTDGDLATLADELEQRLNAQPEQADGWLLLARTRRALGQLGPALEAMEKARTQAPDEPLLLIEQAELIAASRPGMSLAGEPSMLLERALSLDPNAQRALWLLGIAAAQRGDQPEQVRLWQQLAASLTDGSSERALLETELAKLGAAPPTVADAVVGKAETDAATAPSFAVMVEADPSVRPSADAALYLFVRPSAGPPLLARRVAAPEFPLTLTLTASDAMMAGRSPAAGDTVWIGARLSVGAIGASGDPESALVELNVQAGSNEVALRIDRRRP